MTFGIIGQGSFGRLLADILADFGEVLVYDNKIEDKQYDNPLIKKVDIDQLVKVKVIILAVGIDSLKEVCDELADLVNKDTIVADVCSTKTVAAEIMKKSLGGRCQILGTHPLFGPQTIDNKNIKGKNIVICPIEIKDKTKIVDFLDKKLGLKVIEMTPEEHDREMAWVHGLTFFVGRGLMKMNPPKSNLTTEYYQKLIDLVELERSHSIELFNTVERGNPFAAKIRKELMDSLEEINSEIEKEKL